MPLVKPVMNAFDIEKMSQAITANISTQNSLSFFFIVVAFYRSPATVLC